MLDPYGTLDGSTVHKCSTSVCRMNEDKDCGSTARCRALSTQLQSTDMGDIEAGVSVRTSSHWDT